ncbi:chemotaxis protein CheW [uncultured Endozoicomonas sp.]|uniref:chemotaxis protein CheW n=1 Tax=uncultured Endozoicomonas sp. TaxID=432652 RepID=UPI0026343087|nr:chemotaxis protein CheW [uncultured Endozoicomonas sp.]
MSSSTHPFDYLEALEQCASLYAAPMPAEQSELSYWQGISFLLHKQQYVVQLGSVTEILLVPQTTPLPGVHGWVKGIANVRGRLIPIISLTDFLSNDDSLLNIETQRQAKPEASNRILVIEKKDMSVGLIVDEVQGMMQFSANTFSDEIPSSLPTSVHPYTRGSYQKDHHYVVFSIEGLMTSERFLKAASE